MIHIPQQICAVISCWTTLSEAGIVKKLTHLLHPIRVGFDHTPAGNPPYCELPPAQCNLSENVADWLAYTYVYPPSCSPMVVPFPAIAILTGSRNLDPQILQLPSLSKLTIRVILGGGNRDFGQRNVAYREMGFSLQSKSSFLVKAMFFWPYGGSMLTIYRYTRNSCTKRL